MATSYLTFRLATETYAVALDTVSEIVPHPERIARVPTAPDWVRGVFNLRGSVVPALDLCKKLGYASSEPTRRTCVLISHVQVETLSLVLGMIVDAIDDLSELEPGQIEPVPAFGTALRVDCLLGTFRRGDEVVCVLDLPRMFKNDELLSTALSEERALAVTAQLERQRVEAEAQTRAAQRAEAAGAAGVDMGRADPALPGLFLFEET
jgi:purine-binding chemotaxis protein CheW